MKLMHLCITDKTDRFILKASSEDNLRSFFQILGNCDLGLQL